MSAKGSAAPAPPRARTAPRWRRRRRRSSPRRRRPAPATGAPAGGDQRTWSVKSHPGSPLASSGSKPRAQRVDAVAQAGGLRAVGEHVAEVAAAAGAGDLDAAHAVAEVLVGLDAGRPRPAPRSSASPSRSRTWCRRRTARRPQPPHTYMPVALLWRSSPVNGALGALLAGAPRTARGSARPATRPRTWFDLLDHGRQATAGAPKTGRVRRLVTGGAGVARPGGGSLRPPPLDGPAERTAIVLALALEQQAAGVRRPPRPVPRDRRSWSRRSMSRDGTERCGGRVRAGDRRDHHLDEPLLLRRPHEPPVADGRSLGHAVRRRRSRPSVS